MKNKLEAQFQCQVLQEPQNSMADQQRLQISELHFDNFPKHSTFFMLEDKIQNPGKFLLWIKEVEMVESVDDFESVAVNSG